MNQLPESFNAHGELPGDSSGLVASIRLRLLEPRGSWHAAVLPIPEYPVPEPNRVPVALFLDALTQVLRTTYNLHHQVALQVWKLAPHTGSPLVSANRREWKPQLGLGVWPARLPPAGWTEEKLMDAAAAVFRGDEPELPSHRLLRLTMPESARSGPARTMRPFGVLLEMFSRQPEAEVLATAHKTFRPSMTDDAFQNEDFYLPVLDGASFAAAASADVLDRWLCNADFYVRDSPEDHGVLMLSRYQLQPLLEQLKVLLRGDRAENS